MNREKSRPIAEQLAKRSNQSGEENNVPSSSNSEQSSALLSDYGYYCNDKVGMDEMPLSFKDWKQMVINVENEFNQGENPERSATQQAVNQGTEPSEAGTERSNGAQSEPLDPATKNSPLDVLLALVELKDYKDKNGKDEYYENTKPKLWAAARWAIKKHSPAPEPLPPNTPELSGEDLVKVNDVVHLIFSHYSQSGGYTRTATGFIRKLLGREWEYDEELKRLQELASSQQSAPVVQDVEQLKAFIEEIFIQGHKCGCINERQYTDVPVSERLKIMYGDFEANLPAWLNAAQSLSKQSAPLRRCTCENPKPDAEYIDQCGYCFGDLEEQSAPLQDVEELAVGFQNWLHKNNIRADYKQSGELYHYQIENGESKSAGTTKELYQLYAQSLQHRGKGDEPESINQSL